MRKPIELELSREDEMTRLTVRIRHRMDAGIDNPYDPAGNKGADFIQSMVVQLNGKPVVEAQLGASVSDNPRFVFMFASVQAGDKFSVLCTDNKGAETSSDVLASA